MQRHALAFLALTVVAGQVVAQYRIPAKEPKPAPADFHPTLTTPILLLYVQVPAVQADLKLARDQIAGIEALEKNWAEPARIVDLERGARQFDAAGLFTENRKKLGTILTADQLKRLDQIVLRHREKEHGMPAVLSAAVRDLQLSDEQLKRFEVLRRNRADAILEYLTGDDRANAIHRSIYEANSRFVEAVDKLLTDAQRSRLKEMLGEPFAGDIRLPAPRSLAVDAEARRSVYLDVLVGKYGLEAEILNNESVHKELALTNDQIRKAKEFNVEWWAKYEQRRRMGDTQSAAVAMLHEIVQYFILSDVLSEAQRVRFEQIAMQYRKNVAGELAAFAHPAVRDLRTQTIYNMIVEGEPAEQILFEELRIRFLKRLGQPFRGELKINSPLQIKMAESVIPQRAVGPVVDTNRLALAKFMLENARRYRLDEEQTSRLKEIDQDLPKLRMLLHRELSQLPSATDASVVRTAIPEAKAVEQFRKAIFDRCFDVLDARQKSLWGAELRAARAGVLDY